MLTLVTTTIRIVDEAPPICVLATTNATRTTATVAGNNTMILKRCANSAPTARLTMATQIIVYLRGARQREACCSAVKFPPYRVNTSLSGGFRNDAAKAWSPKLHEPAQEPASGTIKRNFGRALSRRGPECSAAPGVCPAPGVLIALGYLRDQMRLSICEGSTSLSSHVLPALSPSRQRQAVRAKRAFSRRSAFAGPRRSS